MNAQELQKHIAWLQHEDIRAFMESDRVIGPWFPAYRSHEKETWFSALVPPTIISRLIKKSSGWDFHIGDGGPTISTGWEDGVKKTSYDAMGIGNGIEPLVINRMFHGMRDGFIELCQEFRLYYNLYPEPARKRFLLIDDNGDESEAARYDSDFFEIRTDLVLKFCAIKQMALAIYVDSFRESKLPLKELGLTETEKRFENEKGEYYFSLNAADPVFKSNSETIAHVVGKRYVLPGEMPTDENKKPEIFQEFIIAADNVGAPIRHICDPEKLANYFGKNSDAPHYLTPVFFRAEVLTKYYANPEKYSVEDGYLRCGGLWGVRIDNDHTDVVVVFLGDLGRDLAEAERNYWLSFNIAPEGRKISETTFRRGFLAEFTDPKKSDLVFKSAYNDFNDRFRRLKGWDFFLPLHDGDKHFLTGLRLLSSDNQAEFDSQLIALTKVLVDSLNESKISQDLKTLAENEKGITKLEKYFKENVASGYESHIKFLRVLQDLRSKSAAHRKGNSYEKLITELQLKDEGQRKIFCSLLTASCEFILFLKSFFMPEEVSKS